MEPSEPAIMAMTMTVIVKVEERKALLPSSDSTACRAGRG